MTHGDDDFQADAFQLANQIIQLGFAFGLQHRLVKVKERISSVSDFSCSSWCWLWRGWFCHWSRCWSSLRSWSWCWSSFRSHDHGAIATSGGCCRSPAGIAPAQAVGTLPSVAGSVAPVVNVLSAGGGSKCCGGNQHRQCIEFLHGSPHGGLSRRLAAKKGNVSSDHHPLR